MGNIGSAGRYNSRKGKSCLDMTTVSVRKKRISRMDIHLLTASRTTLKTFIAPRHTRMAWAT